MTKVIPIDNEYLDQLNKLERAYLEVTARENILHLLINNNQKQSIYYQEIWNEYIQYLKQYGDVKNQFYINYIKQFAQDNNAINWTVDFDRKELILNV